MIRETRSKNLLVRITPSMLERLKKMCAEQGHTQADIVELALEYYERYCMKKQNAKQ